MEKDEAKILISKKNTDLNNEWATIPHYLSHPGYYQNYFRAALIKAQLYNSLADKLGEISKNSRTAEFLNSSLYKFGSTKTDEELMIEITGKSLTEDDFCNRIV